ncbi:MAG: 50S ribosomal protein L35ae [Nanoarchaeota archaeon]|nr:50S ribosomal protein L35ae [Nanoarchaeota archaeon]
MAKGKVIQFRRGVNVIHERHFLLDFGAKSRSEAEKLTGKDVAWVSPAGKKITGKIAGAHGNKGLVRAIFERGLPGQAITTEVEII